MIPGGEETVLRTFVVVYYELLKRELTTFPIVYPPPLFFSFFFFLELERGKRLKVTKGCLKLTSEMWTVPA